MKEIINGKMYDTETAKEVASDKYWDGHNYSRKGRNKTLYKTAKENFFLHHETHWQGEVDHLEPISRTQAMEEFEMLRVKNMEYEEVFGAQPEEA